MKKVHIIKTKEGSFKVYIWFDKNDKAYLVQGVNFPQVITFGKTIVGAKKWLRKL